MDPLIDVKITTRRVLSKGISMPPNESFFSTLRKLSISQRTVDVFEFFGVSFAIQSHVRECVSPDISNNINTRSLHTLLLNILPRHFFH